MRVSAQTCQLHGVRALARHRLHMRDFIRHQRGRMFESDFMEFFSKGHPAIPFAWWIPLGSLVLGSALANGVTTWLTALVFVPIGVLTWQFLEYFFHRYVFHWTGVGPISRRIHDIIHGYHHKYPDDDHRLVFPIGASIPTFALIWGLIYGIFRIFLPTDAALYYAVPYWTMVLAGYLWYDFTHWSTHFRKPRNAYEKHLWAHHLAHHFADPDKNFGIDNMWMDKVMGTLRQTKSSDATE